MANLITLHDAQVNSSIVDIIKLNNLVFDIEDAK